MRVPVLILLATLTLGCIAEGGPGRDEYVPYTAGQLMDDPGTHRNEWVEVHGTITGDAVCGGHSLDGEIALSGGFSWYEGESGTVRGVFQNTISDVECGGTRIDVHEFVPDLAGSIVTS